MDRWMDGWMDGWMYVRMYVCIYVCICFTVIKDTIKLSFQELYDRKNNIIIIYIQVIPLDHTRLVLAKRDNEVLISVRFVWN